MKVLRAIEELDAELVGACVTIGNFDGVHKGHQQLFTRVVKEARQRGAASVAITFHPHPLAVLRPEGIMQISSWQQKEELIAEAGIDYLLAIPFTEEFAKTDAADFVRRVLVEKLQVTTLVVGYDYAFGKGRKGDISFLRQQGKEHSFTVDVVEPFRLHGEIVSSSLIRSLVKNGEMMRTAEFLGRSYQLRGVVKYGQQRGGKELGFPTANLHFCRQELVPKHGVYVVRVEYGGEVYGGVLNIGRNPTFTENELVAETHIFNFNKNIYNQEIKVFLLKYLRGEVRFPSIDALIAGIRKDSEKAKEFLAENP